jgi:hypothetical protein
MQTINTIGCDIYGKTFFLKAFLQEASHAFGIFDNQDSHGLASQIQQNLTR